MRKILLLAGMFLLVWVNTQAQDVRYGVNAGEGIQIDYTNPREYEIAEINFTGLRALEEIALISFTGIRVGDKIRIPGRAISDAIKKLWNQGIIADVQFWLTKVEGNKAFLEVRVTERPKVMSFDIVGVNSTQEADLKEKIGVIGKVASSPLIKNSEITIKNFFIEKGYLNTEVITEQVTDTTSVNGTKLVFRVDRKSKVKINEINFEGNETFEGSQLKKTFNKTNEKPRFWLVSRLFEQVFNATPKSIGRFIDSTEEVTNQDFKDFINQNVKLNILKASKFLDKEYQEDKKQLINFYNSKGYRDAEIVEDEIIKLDDEFINLKVKIDEGSKYYIRNIDWVGNFKYTDEYLDTKLGIQKGDVYNRQRIEERTVFDGQSGDDIQSLYQDDGYLFFRLEVVEVRAENDSIDLEMRMSEGEQATIKRIIIKGNERTSDHVVLREIRTLPGQKYSRKELIRTVRELGQLGYFDPEQVSPQPIPNIQDGTVDIIYNLVEKSSDQIQLSGGFGGPFGFVGTVGLTLNNFSIRNFNDFDKWRPYPSGDGQKFNIQVQSNGRRFQNYSMSFIEPWLGGRKPNNFTVSFNRTVNRQIDFFGGNELLGFLKSTGISVGLGRRLTWPDDYFQIQNSFRFQIYDVFNFGNTLGFSSGRSNAFTFNTNISRSNIDNPTFPRYGSQFTLSVNATPPWSVLNPSRFEGDITDQERYKFVEYHKWMLDLSFFVPLNSKFVINTRAHIGFIGTYSNRTDSGPFERFFLGGNGLNGAQNFVIGQEIIALRGYEDNSIVPVDPTSGFRGGTIYNKFVAEIRYPVSTQPTSTIYLLAFGEAGNTWNNTDDFVTRKLFRSAGLGARIFLPAFGLLGIDWAYGFDEDNSLQRPIAGGSQIHFSIGQQIR